MSAAEVSVIITIYDHPNLLNRGWVSDEYDNSIVIDGDTQAKTVICIASVKRWV
jgi:hypothetical protein